MRWLVLLLGGCQLVFPLEVEPVPDGPPPRTCVTSDECTGGICECGACSFPDPVCPVTGRRWETAAPGLADRCVPAPELVEARVTHACLAMTDGTGWCWGSNDGGQLGAIQPVLIDALVPVPVVSMGTQPLTGIARLGVGTASTCALLEDTSVLCWGSNVQGQLGAGRPRVTMSQEPLPVVGPDGAPLTGVRQLSVGFLHACAIDAQGVVCWGHGSRGQNGALADRPNAERILLPPGNVLHVGAGGEHTCAVIDLAGDSPDAKGVVFCWGRNANGRLGNGLTGQDESRPEPGIVAGLDNVQGISAGNRHTCAIKQPPGEVFCWGDNRNGGIGNNTTLDQTIPARVIDDGDKAGVAAGDLHSCATNNSDLLCWGGDADGEVGDGPSTANKLTPTVIIAGDRQHSIATGFRFSCSIGVDRVFRCWGANGNGELALGNTAAVNVPTVVPPTSFCPKL
jgi:alpha-tubulin suppressor-like RCC1 family protein